MNTHRNNALLGALGFLILIGGFSAGLFVSSGKQASESDEIVLQERISWQTLIWAIGMVESNYNPKAYNASEDAVGILQIRPIYVRDVNRILGERRYSLADRWDAKKSIEMTGIYLKYYTKVYGLKSLPEIIVLHRWGPNGWKPPFSKTKADYCRQVMRFYESVMED